MAKKKSNAGKIGLAGVAAAAAAAAGAYYLYGSENAEKNREKASAWAKKTGAQIEKQAKKGMKIAKSQIAASGIAAEVGKELKKVKKAIKKMKQ